MRSLPPALPVIATLITATFGVSPAHADVATAPDVVVYADPTIAATMRHVGIAFRRSTGVPVRVFTMPTALAIALVRHGARDDVLAIEAGAAEDARVRKLAGPPAVTVHDTVVVAARDGSATSLADIGSASGRVATVDPVSADRLDGPALAAAIPVAAGRVAGQPDGPDAARQVAAGAAAYALVESVDARAAGLRAVAVLPGPARAYAIATARDAISPETARLIDFLHGRDAAAALTGDGWELGR